MDLSNENIKPIEELLAEQLEIHKLKAKEYDDKANYHKGEAERILQVISLLSPSVQRNIQNVPQPTQLNIKVASNEKEGERIRWIKLIMGQFKTEPKAQYNEDLVNKWFPNATEDELREYRAHCSGALGRLEKKGKIRSDRTTGTKGYLWGLPNWFENDTIMDEYK